LFSQANSVKKKFIWTKKIS